MKRSVFISVLILVLMSCHNAQSDWKGTVEEVDGVTVVKNPVEPLYGALAFDLEEDLSIGNDQDDNFLFYRIRNIDLDADGNIYVLEAGNFRVQKFDRDGHYLCTIGKKGQGPGEFQRPFQFFVDDAHGTIIVQDMRKLVIFDKEGHYLDRDIVLDNFFIEILVDSFGDLWGNMYRQVGDDEATADMFKVFVKIDSEGHPVTEVAEFPYNNYRERIGDSVLSVSTGEEYSLHISKVDKQRLVYGYMETYELSIVDLTGRVIRKFTKEEPSVKFAAEERKKHKRAVLPEFKPFFYALFSDSSGRIYVQRNNVRMTEQVDKIFDVFSADGYFLYTTVCPVTPYKIADGYFYTREADEETGDVFVKRFRIKNWDRIKTGIK